MARKLSIEFEGAIIRPTGTDGGDGCLRQTCGAEPAGSSGVFVRGHGIGGVSGRGAAGAEASDERRA